MSDHLDADEQKRLANRAIPALLLAGYTVSCDPEVFDEALYEQAVHRLRVRTAPRRPAATGARQFSLAHRTGPHPVRHPGGPGTTPGPPPPRPDSRRNP